jgi:hypothetical protein
MIDIKCMGLINRTIKLNSSSDYTATSIKEKIAVELNVKSVDVVLKIAGRQLLDDDMVSNGAKLLSIIKPPSVKPAAPAPSLDAPPKQCVGWKRVCQFFTNGACEYCSLCEKRRVRETSNAKLTASSEPAINSTNSSITDTVPVQTDESKCWDCKKYVGLLGFSCSCGFKYCALHRYPESHTCSFDHKASRKHKLESELLGGVCNSSKVSKL